MVTMRPHMPRVEQIKEGKGKRPKEQDVEGAERGVENLQETLGSSRR